LPHYAQAAEFYDLLYASVKDYEAESRHIASVLRATHPRARRVLDVGCGTGQHAAHLTAEGFRVDGVDLEPAFVEIARARCPGGRFTVADMTTLDLPDRYDAVVSLFSAVGYAVTVARLNQALARMASQLAPGGVVVVDPWFEPGQLTHGRVMVVSGQRDGLAVARVSRTLLEGKTSVLEFEYLIGRPSGIERRHERHELGLFTQAEMEAAFRAAGLDVTRRPEEDGTRGLYVGRAASG